MTMVKLAIDFENSSSLWWESGGRDLWEGVAEGFDNNEVLLESSIADSWLVAAAVLPGWSDGPEFAPNPVRIKPVAEDEEL